MNRDGALSGASPCSAASGDQSAGQLGLGNHLFCTDIPRVSLHKEQLHAETLLTGGARELEEVLEARRVRHDVPSAHVQPTPRALHADRAQTVKKLHPFLTPVLLATSHAVVAPHPGGVAQRLSIRVLCDGTVGCQEQRSKTEQHTFICAVVNCSNRTTGGQALARFARAVPGTHGGWPPDGVRRPPEQRRNGRTYQIVTQK